MKKLIISAFMLAAVASYAQDKKVTADTPVQAAAVKDESAKTKVDPAALPEPVKTTLSAETYKDWKIAEAWVVKAEQEYYMVDLKKDDKTITVNIDKDGKVKSN